MQSVAEPHESIDPITADTDDAKDDAKDDVWRKLFHRWFIEYNPLYLLSAALVLGGVIVLSKEVALAGILGQLGVAAIAEAYAWSLLGGIALLMRLGLRRPAVLLALITALYQGDLTLHTETCAYLGSVGIPASFLWLVLFVSKLGVLAWVLRLRISPSAWLLSTLGAMGLALFPHFFQKLSAFEITQLAGLWLFSLGAVALWSSPVVQSKTSLDSWGKTVLRRSTLAVWLLWLVLLGLHLYFWSTESRFEGFVLVPVVALLSLRWVDEESLVWCGAVAILLAVGFFLPHYVSIATLMTAVVLLLRAIRGPVCLVKNPYTQSEEPYRISGVPSPSPNPVSMVFGAPPRPVQARYYVGVVFGFYLFLWTFGWNGGPLPEHLLVLDASITVAIALLVWRLRVWIGILPWSLTVLHWAVQVRLLMAPQSTLGWGALSVGAGFALLMLSLGVAWGYRPNRAPR